MSRNLHTLVTIHNRNRREGEKASFSFLHTEMERHCFRYVVVLFAIVISVDNLRHAAGGRELRPSDHGLAYQDSSKPAKKQDVVDMLSFFGRTPPPPLELPEGKNVTGAWWSDTVEASPSRDGERKHHLMKEVLLVASLVCGVTGAGLLAAAAFLVASRRRDRRRETSISMSTLAPNVVVHK